MKASHDPVYTCVLSGWGEGSVSVRVPMMLFNLRGPMLWSVMYNIILGHFGLVCVRVFDQ